MMQMAIALRVYHTRCGENVHVTRRNGNTFFGHHQRFPSLELSWNAQGRRIPAAGQDPYDLMLGYVEVTECQAQ